MGDTDRKPEKLDMSEILGTQSDEADDSAEIIVLDPSTGETLAGTVPVDMGQASAATDEALRAILAEKDKYHDLWVRVRADFDNYRKRIEREREEERGRAGSALVRDLLPIADNLERALAGGPSGDPFRDGILLVLRQFTDCLGKAGLEPIEALGTPFDPVYHEAVATEPTGRFEPNRVLEEVRKGYLFMGRVLRPSLVRVSVSPRERQESPESSDPEAVGGSGGA